MRFILITVLAATLATGCWPMSQTTRQTSARTLGTLEIGQPGQVELSIERSVPGTVIVSATRPYQCRRQVVEHVDVTTSTHARMFGTSDGDPRGYWLLWPMLIAYPVGIANVAIAGTVALLTPDKHRHEQNGARTLVSTCHAPARVRVYVALSSGPDLVSLTDEHGIAAFVLPVGEDPKTVRVRSDQWLPPEPVEEDVDGTTITITPDTPR